MELINLPDIYSDGVYEVYTSTGLIVEFNVIIDVDTSVYDTDFYSLPTVEHRIRLLVARFIGASDDDGEVELQAGVIDALEKQFQDYLESLFE